MPLFAPQRRDRRPFVSVKQRRLARTQIKLLSEHLATLDDPDLSLALKAALKAMGFKPPRKNVPAASPNSESLFEGEKTQEGAAGPPIIPEKPAAIKPEKSRITSMMAELITGRPDIAEALTAIANESTPPTVRIPLMRKFIKEHPPE